MEIMLGKRTPRAWASFFEAQMAGGLTGAVLCFQAGVAHELVLGPMKGHNWFQVGMGFRP